MLYDFDKLIPKKPTAYNNKLKRSTLSPPNFAEKYVEGIAKTIAKKLITVWNDPT